MYEVSFEYVWPFFRVRKVGTCKWYWDDDDLSLHDNYKNYLLLYYSHRCRVGIDYYFKQHKKNINM